MPLAAVADDGLLQSKEFHDLSLYFAQTVISWGVPAAVVGTVGIAIASAGRGGGANDEPPPLPPALAKALGVQDGPKEYLEIEKLNSKLESYEFSFTKASISKSSALRKRGRQEIERQFGATFESFGLDTETVNKIYQSAKAYRRAEERVTKKLETKLIELRTTSLSVEAGKVGAKAKEHVTEAAEGTKSAEGHTEDAGGAAQGGLGGMFKSNPLSALGRNRANKALLKEISSLQSQRLELELDFLKRLSETLGKEKAEELAGVLGPSAPGAGGGGGAPSRGGPMRGGAMAAIGAEDNESGVARLGGRLDALSALVTAAAEAAGKSKHVFVLKFFGDVTASQVAQLRQEITAVLRSADPEGRGDEVVLVLNTGGGTVTGYGLAAAQLLRLKDAGLGLTICVEQVAASGGYMMACVADKLVASPFAVLGSIGVITEQPNVYERLKREGVSFSTITAGKFKRTLTPTKKVDPADEKKLKQDIEQILKLFKTFVATNRPSVDIEKIATGETWFGPDALERNMVDELATVDDVLLRHVDAGAQVFGVKYTEKPASPLAAFGIGGEAAAAAAAAALLGKGSGFGGGAAAGWQEVVARALLSRGSATPPPMLRAPDEPEMLAARPTDAAEPMLQWGGEANPQARDSWHL